MIITGWNTRYLEILKEFRYDKRRDIESAEILNLILKNSDSLQKIKKMISNKEVFVIGSGPSLSAAVPFLKKFEKNVKIVADSAIKPLIKNGVIPNVVVTDLDGDEKSLKKIGQTQAIFVVHAHGDNMTRLQTVENFKNCIGTTQTKAFGKIQNFGGFTDGDRAVFLANYFNAKKIILFGMDFGNRIGKFSNTKQSDKKIKLRKLEKAEFLLEWLSKKSKSKLFTTSKPIVGFQKINYRELDIIIT